MAHCPPIFRFPGDAAPSRALTSIEVGQTIVFRGLSTLRGVGQTIVFRGLSKWALAPRNFMKSCRPRWDRRSFFVVCRRRSGWRAGPFSTLSTLGGVGQTIVFRGLSKWALAPRNFMKNCRPRWDRRSFFVVCRRRSGWRAGPFSTLSTLRGVGQTIVFRGLSTLAARSVVHQRGLTPFSGAGR
jgi:hypothetical protein